MAVRKQRDALAEKCARHAWSARRLESEIQLLVPRRKYGGRGPAPPVSMQEAMIVTEKLADGWVRWIRVLTSAKKEAKQKGVKLSELPRPIRTRLMAITIEAELLTAAIERQLGLTAAKSSKHTTRK